MNTKKTMVILAGGLGSRYNGLKQVDGILDNGAPLMEYSIHDAMEAGFTKVVVIINKLIPASYLERLEKILSGKNIELVWVYQNLEDFIPEDYDLSERQKPWGTGHALLCTKDVVKEPFIILNADDFYGKGAYKMAAESIEKGEIDPSHYQIIAYQLEPTLSANGTVSRGVCEVGPDGMLTKITERTTIAKEGDTIYFTEGETKEALESNTPVSMNFWVFEPSVYEFVEKEFQEFLKTNPGPKTEFLIPTLAQAMVNEGKASFRVKTSTGTWMGVTYAADKPEMQNFLKNEIANSQYSENLWN